MIKVKMIKSTGKSNNLQFAILCFKFQVLSQHNQPVEILLKQLTVSYRINADKNVISSANISSLAFNMAKGALLRNIEKRRADKMVP